MSGHSHWSTIRRKKEANDAKKGAVFTKVAREIVIAAREGGGDPDSNMRLRMVLDKARSMGMPKDNIERAVKRGAGDDKDAAEIVEIMYEGYGPNGVAILIDVMTDNRNRTIAALRHAHPPGRFHGRSRVGCLAIRTPRCDWRPRKCGFRQAL